MNTRYLSATLLMTGSTVYLQVLLPFALTSFVSTEMFAAWAFWFSLLSFLWLGDFGMLSLAQHRSLRSKSERAGRPTAYLTVLAPTLGVISLVFLAIVGALTLLTDVPVFFFILSVVPLLQLQTRLASILYRLRGTFDRYCYAMSVSNFVFPPLVLLVGEEGVSLTIIALLYLAVHSLVSAVVVGQSQLWGSAVFSFRRFETLYLKRASTCGVYVILALVPTILNTVPILVLGTLFQPGQLVQFYAARIVGNLGVVVANSIYSSNMPELVERNRSKRDVYRTVFRIVQLVMAFFVLQTGVAFFFRGPLEVYWLNGSVTLSAPILVIALFSSFCASLIYFAINTFQAFGTPAKAVNALLTYLLCLGVVLVVFWGPFAGQVPEMGTGVQIALVVALPAFVTAIVSVLLAVRVIRQNAVTRAKG